jgi:Icc-related predicted phosphoesterase
MKLVALPDLHDGGIKYLPNMRTVLTDADVVLLPGDLTTLGDAAAAARIVDAVREYNPRVLAVPGNWDTRGVNQYLSQQNINLHGSNCIHDGIAFVGAGGSLPYSGAPKMQMLYDNIQYEMILQEAVTGLSRRFPRILVSHQPPFENATDLQFSGTHSGSRAIRQFIEETQPLICFTGHIHEIQAVDQIDQTYVINPGPIWLSRSYAYAEIDNNRVQTLEIRPIEG